MLDQSPASPGSDTECDEKDSRAETRHERQSSWPITHEVQNLLERNEGNRDKRRKLGVTWSDLTVKGVSNDAVFNENVLSQFNPFGKSNKGAPLKTIIQSSSGCVKPGGTSRIFRTEDISVLTATLHGQRCSLSSETQVRAALPCSTYSRIDG